MRGTPLPFYHSINKNTLVFGKINKPAFDLLITLILAIAFSGKFINVYTDAFAGIFFIIGFILAKQLTRIDPQIVEVYRRHINYRSYYKPQSGIHALVKIIKPSAPFYDGLGGIN